MISQRVVSVLLGAGAVAGVDSKPTIDKLVHLYFSNKYIYVFLPVQMLELWWRWKPKALSLSCFCTIYIYIYIYIYMNGFCDIKKWYWVVKLSTIRTNGLLVFEKISPLLYEYNYPEVTKWHTQVNDQLWVQNEKPVWILWRAYLSIYLEVCSNQKWNTILFYLTHSIEWY